MHDVTRRGALGGLAALALAAPARAAAAVAPIPISSFATVVEGLKTPEGVAADRAGDIYVSNQASACVIIRRDGTLRHVGPPGAANGVALDGKGGLLIASFGLLHHGPGPLLRLDLQTGRVEEVAGKVGGRTLVASNFPVVSRDGGVYCSHSKWSDPGVIGDRRADGFVYRVSSGRVEVVTPGVRGANGCCFDRDERHLYVAQTPAGNVLRMRRLDDGRFGPPEAYGPVLGAVAPDAGAAEIRARIAAGDRDLGYTDGLAFDVDGNLWVTLPFANKVVAITPDLRVVTVVSDPEARLMDMPTNLAFGGPDLRDLYIVSRQRGNVIRARSPVAGLPLVGQ
jgi:gluconolactonase